MMNDTVRGRNRKRRNNVSLLLVICRGINTYRSPTRTMSSTSATSTTTVASALLVLLLPQLFSHDDSSPLFVVDAATATTTTSSSAMSPRSTSLLQQLPLGASTTMTTTTIHKRRGRQRRRRNNTGFFYGIREDDILFPFFSTTSEEREGHRTNNSAAAAAAAGGGGGGAHMQQWFALLMRQKFVPPWWLKLQRDTIHLLPPSRAVHLDEQQVQMISTKPNRQHRPRQQTQHRKDSLVLPSQTIATNNDSRSITTNLMSRGKEEKDRLDVQLIIQTQKRRKRRNNTGFYYGIREDVLTMPPSQPVQFPSSSSSSSIPSSVAANSIQPTTPAAVAGDTLTSPILTQSPMTDAPDRQQRQHQQPLQQQTPPPKRDGTSLSKSKNDGVGDYNVEEKKNNNKQSTPSLKSKIIGNNNPTSTSSIGGIGGGGNGRTSTSSTSKDTSTPSKNSVSRNKEKKNISNNRNNISRNMESNNNINNNESLLLSEAIQELRGMREEISALREELRVVKTKNVEEENERRVGSQGRGIRERSTSGDSIGEGEEEDYYAKPKWWRQQQLSPPPPLLKKVEEEKVDYLVDDIPEIWEDEEDEVGGKSRQHPLAVPQEKWDAYDDSKNNDEDDYYNDTEERNPLDRSRSRSLFKQKQLQQRRRKEELERIGSDVEKWASTLLSDEEGWGGGRTGTAIVRGGGGGGGGGDYARDEDDYLQQQQQQQRDDGWKEITCNNFVKKKFNQFGQTRVFLKWMPDSRDENDIESTEPPSQQPLYPCLKCYSTFDAPLDRVCSFLANPNTMTLYNELIDDHRDVEIISPSSKITWCKVPKILFVKPRDFVTYCSHRWKRDGTQVIVNQACEHEDMPGVMVEGQGDVCRGFALRGANFISKDPDDPNKTRITMLSHANPGGGLPQWAMNTAVNAAVQIEPFKFFHKINESICNYREPLQYSNTQSSNVGGFQGRSNKPAGIAHLGFTCFWPDGGGLKESGHSHAPQQPYRQQDEWGSEDDDAGLEELED